MKSIIALFFISCIAITGIAARVYKTGDKDIPLQWDEVVAIIEAYDDITALHFVTGEFGASQNEFAFEYIKGSGIINGESIHPTASAAKEISISAAMVAVERGYLSLSDHPSRYLDYWTTNQADKRSRVTLGQLMSFTSSMRSVSCTGMNMAQCVRAYYDENEGMVDEPGTTFWYSTTDFQVVAEMVVQATGYPDWISWFNFALHGPLNLPNTTRYTSETNPSLAGGMETSHYGYLMWFVPYFSHQFHEEHTYNSINTDMTPAGKVELTSSAYAPYPTHYALGHWLECYNLPDWDDSCYEANWRSTCGAWGLNPFKDLQYNYFGSIMSMEGSSAAVGLTAELHPYIATAYGHTNVNFNVTRPKLAMMSMRDI